MSWKEKQTTHELAIVQRVAEIVARGNVARFARPHDDFDMTVVKHVDSTKRSEETGDLIGNWSNGSTQFVAAWRTDYTLTEITQDEAAKERGGPIGPPVFRIHCHVVGEPNEPKAN